MLEQLHDGFLFDRLRRQPHMCDLLADSETAIEELGERIAAADGRVAMLAHPFYTDGWAAHFPIDRQYRTQLHSLITNVNEEGLPLVIFEESTETAKLNPRLPQLDQPAFLVRTIPDDAIPDVFPQVAHLSREEKRRALDELIATSLKNNNAQRALVGGRYLFTDTIYRSPDWYQHFTTRVEDLETGREWANRSLYPNGCVGTVVKSLFRNGIEVDIVPATSPRIPFQDVRDSEPVLLAGELF